MAIVSLKSLNINIQELIIKNLKYNSYNLIFNSDILNYTPMEFVDISVKNLSNNKLGSIIEDELTVNGVCPLCGMKTLRKYKNKIMPIVDLICINPIHLIKKECFVYQIKSTTQENGYFSLSKKYIKIGKNYLSSYIHTSNDILLRPGYICIKYSFNNDKTIIDIDTKKSFILLPNNLTSCYSIKHNKVKNTLFWNDSVKTIPIMMIMKNQINLKSIIRIEYIQSKNPYGFLVDF